ncbi:hypothetical protein [Dysgonomonas sp. 511]|uniref:hypothetical protein n=1 Tax=Dysgonomonas sp. 511 TaxID=2302930 RepID=UPI0013D787FF|nr:hypothetical protein [Dysgonomonas sp. 511]NDV80315.1 hypothetical protein [Dysgonomonas sp. 511]
MSGQPKINYLHQQLCWVTQNIIDAICCIKEIPEDLLPHIVFVEEVNGKGEPCYTKYQMVDIDPVEKNCIIYDKETDFREEISLEAINTDWLITIWNRYLELSEENEPEPKSLYVFLYPAERFGRNATDEEIVYDYDVDEGQDPCVEKYTFDEFAAMMNDGERFPDMYIRFINYS